jgi:uncharacterized membrane protein
VSDSPPAPHPQPSQGTDLRLLVIVCYFLFLIACINGLTGLIGVLVAHSRLRPSAGTVWQSHFRNMILVFWVLVAALLIVMVNWPLGVWAGFAAFIFQQSPAVLIWPLWLFIFPLVFSVVVFPVLVIWYFYRVIRGLVRAAEARPFRG